MWQIYSVFVKNSLCDSVFMNVVILIFLNAFFSSISRFRRILNLIEWVMCNATHIQASVVLVDLVFFSSFSIYDEENDIFSCVVLIDEIVPFSFFWLMYLIVFWCHIIHITVFLIAKKTFNCSSLLVLLSFINNIHRYF